MYSKVLEKSSAHYPAKKRLISRYSPLQNSRKKTESKICIPDYPNALLDYWMSRCSVTIAGLCTIAANIYIGLKKYLLARKRISVPYTVQCSIK